MSPRRHSSSRALLPIQRWAHAIQGSREKEERPVGSGGRLDQLFLTRSSSLPKRQLGQAFQTVGFTPHICL
ncbi:hypothetical protein MRX96_001238 [Rhipicephalus microplus]